MRHRTWNFDIDRFLNPLVPPPPWRWLPYPVARFLGYRRTAPAETGNLMPIFWAFLGILGCILVIEAVSSHVPVFKDHGAPMIVGSFGAAAVLEFYAIESPLSQPRNAVLGQTLASIVGVGVAKLFQLSDRFHQIRWVGGALSCASATALMALTKTVHPPAGATALLAVADDHLVALGWLLVPLVLLGCALMLAVALLVNNIERRFPLYWWTPMDLRQRRPVGRPALVVVRRAGWRIGGRKAKQEQQVRQQRRQQQQQQRQQRQQRQRDEEEAEHEGKVGAEDEYDDDDDQVVLPGSNNRVLTHDEERTVGGDGSGPDAPHPAPPGAGTTTLWSRAPAEVVIRPGQVFVPEHMLRALTPEETVLLESMSHRL
ncbi:hypothetical protein CDD83_1034 [Cordyceps sp. RAO-2017]|nr:hypothetical protein CDD83_1034 [Cordyceps sp. RAO-2017]